MAKLGDWRVELRGEKLDLDHLSRQLEGAEISCIEDGGRRFLSSPRFHAQAEAREVDADARELLAELNAVLKLEWRNAEPLALGEIQQRTENGWTSSVAATMKSRAHMFCDGVALVDGKEQPAPRPRLQQILDAAETDDEVRDVLHHLGSEPSWYGMYKVYELIEGTGWKEHTALSSTQLARFARTANAHHRHAGRKFKPPRNPMPYDEAAELIRRLATEWLETRVPRE